MKTLNDGKSAAADPVKDQATMVFAKTDLSDLEGMSPEKVQEILSNCNVKLVNAFNHR